MAIRMEEGVTSSEGLGVKPPAITALRLLPYVPWVVALIFLIIAALTVWMPEVREYLSLKITPVLLVIVMVCVGLSFVASDVRRLLSGISGYAENLRTMFVDGSLLESGVPSEPGLEELAESINQMLVHVRDRQHSSTDLLASNRVLARELDRLLLLLDSASDGLVAVDNTGDVIFANRQSAAYLEVPPSEAVGKSAKACVGHADVRRLLIERTQGGSVHGVRSVQLTDESGHARKDVSVSHSYGVDEDETVVGQMLMFRDVTHAKKVEKQQSEFIDRVAKELSRPLTDIRIGMESLISSADLPADERYAVIKQVHDESARLSRLIESLLNMSLLESGAATLEIAPTRLRGVLETVVNHHRPQCAQQGINIETQLPDRLPALNVDKRLFTLALMNLMGNAVKYTPEKGNIQLTTSTNDEEIAITVVDSGAGIADSELAGLFDKFSQPGEGEDQSTRGRTYGLATAQQIIRLHGGEIRVSSTVGQGSQFSIVLPRSLVNTSIGE